MHFLVFLFQVHPPFRPASLKPYDCACMHSRYVSPKTLHLCMCLKVCPYLLIVCVRCTGCHRATERWLGNRIKCQMTTVRQWSPTSRSVQRQFVFYHVSAAYYSCGRFGWLPNQISANSLTMSELPSSPRLELKMNSPSKTCISTVTLNSFLPPLSSPLMTLSF